MNQLNLALAVTGAVIVLIALYSSPIKQGLLQEPLIAVLVGVAVGPYGFGWLDIAKWGHENTVLEQGARLTLAVGLMGVALRLKKPSVCALLKPVTVLLTLGMLGMWLVSSALSGWLLGLSFWTALLLGAVVTPTDPVVASSIVTGKFAEQHLPLRLRDTISFESGANDGLAYLFVMLPVMMLQDSPDQAWAKWLTGSLLTAGLGGSLVGCVIGYVAARLLNIAEDRGIIESTSLLGFTVALSLLTLGAARLLGGDALLAVFLAGLVFNLKTQRHQEHDEENVQEAIAKLFTLPMFVAFGVALPFAAWRQLGCPLLCLAVLILLLRRPPVIVMLLPVLKNDLTRRDTVYLSWFGPIGIAAIYYAALGQKHLHDPLTWHAGSALIFASILVHGVTAAPFSRVYAKKPQAAPPGTRHLKNEQQAD